MQPSEQQASTSQSVRPKTWSEIEISREPQVCAEVQHIDIRTPARNNRIFEALLLHIWTQAVGDNLCCVSHKYEWSIRKVRVCYHGQVLLQQVVGQPSSSSIPESCSRIASRCHPQMTARARIPRSQGQMAPYLLYTVLQQHRKVPLPPTSPNASSTSRTLGRMSSGRQFQIGRGPLVIPVAYAKFG